MAHTPGPWTVEYVVDGAFQVIDAESCVIASRGPFQKRHAEFIDNANLIAAAPDLLAALSALLQKLPPHEQPHEASPDKCNYCELMNAAYGAIAKAEGR